MIWLQLLAIPQGKYLGTTFLCGSESVPTFFQITIVIL